MNYLRIYYELIAKTSNRDYLNEKYDVHHIIPVYIGGPDHLLNIALLTPREHRLAHKLLRKFMPSRSHDPILPVEGESRTRTMLRIKAELKKKTQSAKDKKIRKKHKKRAKKPMTQVERNKKYRERKRNGLTGKK